MNAAWAHFEDTVFMLLFSVLGSVNMGAKEAVRNELDFKPVCAILKSTAIIDPRLPARDHILQLVAWTERPLREDRNRFVHDPIYFGGSDVGYEQYHFVTRKKKPQSFKPERVTTLSYRSLTKPIIDRFTEAVRKAEHYAGWINHHLSDEPEDFRALPEVEAVAEELRAAIASYIALTKSAGAK